MPRVQRSADVVWEGTVARGSGRIAGRTGAFELPYSLPSRVAKPDGKTSPEELLAAAHAGCFAMSLASEIAKTGIQPDRVDVGVTITLDEVPDQGHQIVGSAVDVRASARGIDRDRLDVAVADAHAGCTFSALLARAGAEITVNAELEG